MRRRVTREQVLKTAMRLVDRHRVGALSMRTLATGFGVAVTAIYYHVDNLASFNGCGTSLSRFGQLPRAPR